ncbi:hypothetical protein ACMFMF_006907 [Clarireedia jacksonii]
MVPDDLDSLYSERDRFTYNRVTHRNQGRFRESRPLHTLCRNCVRCLERGDPPSSAIVEGLRRFGMSRLEALAAMSPAQHDELAARLMDGDREDDKDIDF